MSQSRRKFKIGVKSDGSRTRTFRSSLSATIEPDNGTETALSIPALRRLAEVFRQIRDRVGPATSTKLANVEGKLGGSDRSIPSARGENRGAHSRGEEEKPK